MHLNSAVHAGARQVLCPGPDPFGALEAAARAGATHFYAPPARLHRLAGDPGWARPVPGRAPAG